MLNYTNRRHSIIGSGINVQQDELIHGHLFEIMSHKSQRDEIK